LVLGGGRPRRRHRPGRRHRRRPSRMPLHLHRRKPSRNTCQQFQKIVFGSRGGCRHGCGSRCRLDEGHPASLHKRIVISHGNRRFLDESRPDPVGNQFVILIWCPCGPDFGWRANLTIGPPAGRRPAGGRSFRVFRLESKRNPARTDLHGLWPAKAPREALWPAYQP
jgi:hypothetical protein